MKYLKILIVLLLSACQQKVADEPGAIDKAAAATIEPFLNSLKQGNPASLQKLLASNSNIKLDDSTMQDLDSKFRIINSNSGAFVGYRLIKKKKIGEDVAVYSYLVKYEAIFYRFLFVFYNNDQSVKLYKFSFDDEIVYEMETALKYYAE